MRRIDLDYKASTPIDPAVAAVMSIRPESGIGSVRFSLGRATTAGEIDEVLERLSGVLLRPL